MLITTRRRLFMGIGAAALGATATLAVQPAAVADEARPSARTFQECRGLTVDKHAPVISTASVFVKASPKTVWRLHTNIDNWSSWIPEITPAQKKTPGPLRPGSVFEWSPQGMHVTSTVKKVRTERCTAWAAPVNGIAGVHLFTFKPVKGGVIATTQESWSGAPAEADIPGNQASLDTGLRDWVNRLKETAETQHACH
ncbi:SRPBCC family protein [Streptomyces sp. AcH 505]|uniref:SRPBCC family protein n=1 Tax=Streptomyces sp. AcH 505 TaxID=352211 RepID=UPI0006936180